MRPRLHYQYYGDPDYQPLCEFVRDIIEGVGEFPKIDTSCVDMETVDKEFIENDFQGWKCYSNKKRQKESPFNENGEIVKTCFSFNHPINSFASNFSSENCNPIEIWGKKYSSPDKILAVKKAEWMKDPLLGQIMEEEDPYKLKRLHGTIQWRGGLTSWTIFAFELLGIANEAKYRQNRDIRKRLFGTVGLLVESDTGRNQWCCGLKKYDTELSNRSKWPEGCWNLNGDMLTMLRVNLSSSEEFSDEFNEIYQETLQKYRSGVKRDRENLSPPISAKRNK